MSEKVKITIRLPEPVVKMAKLHALALDEDLQDLVGRVLMDYFRSEPIPASLSHVLRAHRVRRKGGK